jgi:hypothetical protein
LNAVEGHATRGVAPTAPDASRRALQQAVKAACLDADIAADTPAAG